MAKTYEIAFALAANTASFSANFKAASRTVARLQESFKSLEGAARQLGALQSARQKVMESGKAYKEAAANVAKLQQAMSACERPTRAQQTALERAQASANRAKEAWQRNITKMREMAAAANATGQPIRALAQRENELTQAANRTAQALQRQQAAEARLGRAKAGVAANAPYAQQAGATVGSGLMAAMTDGASLERQLSQVQAISRASADEMARYEAQALQLGASTKYTSTQVAQGMQYLAMAGFKTNEVLAAMPGMLNLASAGAIDLGRAADISSNILSAFGLQTAEIDRVGDVLTNTFQRSNTTLETLSDTMKYCAPVAKQFGLSLEQTAAYAGILGSNGIDASMAGTALRGIMVRLTKQPKQAATALKELGVKIYDAKGNFKSLEQIMVEVAQAQDKLGLTEFGKAKSAAMLFGTEALAAGQVLLDNARSGKLQEMIAGQYERGTAEATAKVQEGNLIGDITKLTSAMSGLSQTLYKSVNGSLRETIQHVTDLVGRLNTWLQANPEVARTIVLVAGGIAAFAAAILPCIIAVKTISFAVAALQAGFMLLASPMGLIVVAIMALVAAGIYLYTHWEQVSAWASRTWSAISVAISIFCIEAGQWLHQTWDGIATWFQGVWDGVKAVFQGVLAFVTGTFQAGWSVAWSAVSGVFSGIWNGFKGVAQSVLDWIANKLNSVIGLINSSIEMMNKIPGVDIGKIDQIPTSQQKVPAMASGGIVMDPTLAMVGEGGGPEAVVPLDRLSSMLGQYAGGGQGQNSTITINVQAPVSFGSASSDPYEAVRRGLSAGADEIKRQLERVLADQRRLSYA